MLLSFYVSFNWKDRLRNYPLIQRMAAFVFSVFIIALFLPKEALFKFEYQINQPWKHDKLFAPFDFGIRKGAEQVKSEEQKIKKEQYPVFSIDRAATEQGLHRIDEAWMAGMDTLKPCDSLKTLHIRKMLDLLNRGIIRTDSVVASLKPDDFMLLQRSDKLERIHFGETVSLDDALQELRSFVQQFEDSLCSVLADSLSKRYLISNAVYNDSLTQRLIEDKISDIILLEGKMNRGQVIIDEGEIVSPERHKVLESLKQEYAARTISETGFQWSLIGSLGIVVILLGLLMLFVYLGQDRLFNDPRPITLALTLVTVSFVVTSLAHGSSSLSIYAIPIGITPLLIRMFFDFRISIFTFFALVLITAIFSTNPLEYIILQSSAISFATLYQASSTKRSRTLGTAMLVFAGYSVIYVVISLAQNGNLNGISNAYFGWFAINGLLCMMVFPLIYLVEKVFGYTSETTLLELSDSNQPLLKELAVKAPGTFQHSLQVANLAEKVAAQIGGSPILLRTAAMYHDIGKMNDPQFFIENQLPDNNPHDDLEPDESASIIIGHVSKGIELGSKAELPFDIIQFIQTHHGTSKVRYFLKRAIAMNGEVDEMQFTYPGPPPNTKEQAILMMADSVEAASRSLQTFDHLSLENLVDRIIDGQLSDGQFENAPITFKDITGAKQVLKSALKGIYHQRISYD